MVTATSPSVGPDWKFRPRRIGDAIRAHKWMLVAAIVVALVIVARIVAPVVMQRYANSMLNDTEGFRGQVGDVDLHLWRGAYSVQSTRIEKLDQGKWRPYVATQRVDLTLDWSALAHGRIVGKATIDQPELYYVETAAKPEGGKESEKEQKKEDKKQGTDEENPAEDNPNLQESDIWMAKFKKLLPMRFNTIDFSHATVHYLNADRSFDLVTSEMSGSISNLTNIEEAKAGESMVAKAYALGQIAGGGSLYLDANIDPSATLPTFDLIAAIEDVDLPTLNPILRDQGDITVKRGILSVYMDIAAKDGQLSGYVKPIVKDLDLSEFKQDRRERGTGKAIKQALAGAAAKIVQNKKHDQQATEIPVEGEIENPKSSLLAIIGGVLRNGFVSALKPGLGKGD